jgi:hypothetical protein
MNRRTAIRNFVIISAGVAFLPSCADHERSASIILKNIPLTGSQEELVAALSASIIPKTNDFIGASDLKAHEFVLTMVDDCNGPEDQQHFIKGMKDFEELCKKKYDKGFISCTPQQKLELLQQFEKKQDIPEEAARFYEIIKRYTVQSFTTSKEYMTTVRNYKMIPGSHYKGCVPAINS